MAKKKIEPKTETTTVILDFTEAPIVSVEYGENFLIVKEVEGQNDPTPLCKHKMALCDGTLKFCNCHSGTTDEHDRLANIHMHSNSQFDDDLPCY